MRIQKPKRESRSVEGYAACRCLLTTCICALNCNCFSVPIKESLAEEKVENLRKGNYSVNASYANMRA